MRPEKEKLLGDLWEGRDARRDATLSGARRILRRRRWVRRANSAGLVLVTLLLICAGFYFGHPSRNRNLEDFQTSVRAKEPACEMLTDEQLLALFPGTPMGVIKAKDGRSRLVFFRSQDEARYVTKF